MHASFDGPPSPHEPASAWTRRHFVGAAAASAALAGAPGLVAGAEPPGAADRTRLAAMLKDAAPITWVVTGDSITQGALHCRGYRSYPEHLAERVRWELRRVRDVVINTGVSGEQMPGLLADVEWRVLRYQPHVVSIMMGMNDCSKGESGREPFRQRQIELVEMVRKAKAIPVLNTPNTVIVANSPGRGDLPAYMQITREVAAATNSILVDHYAHWEKVRPDRAGMERWLEDASIHPGVYGHREMAKLLFRELGIYDDNSPTCQLETP